MGGSSYDRDVYSSSSSGAWSGNFGSDASKKAFRGTTLDESMFPYGRTLRANCRVPILVMLDVTGSNIDFARIVYDKMPMFFGQIEQQNYLDDFEIAVCAVGDAYSDKYPLQIPEFGKGIEIDSWLTKLVLEGGGGGQKRESYELAAYYLAKHFEFRDDAEPIVFFIADESPYAQVSDSQVRNIVADEPVEDQRPFETLAKSIHNRLYLILNPYGGRSQDQSIYDDWRNVVDPEHIVRFGIGQEKSIVDTMLGIIALSFGTRSIAAYKNDMVGRGQTQERVSAVIANLGTLRLEASEPKKLSGLKSLFSLPRSEDDSKRT